MSIRALSTRLFRHGQTYVRNICRREYNTTNIADKINVIQQVSSSSSNVGSQQIVRRTFALRNVGVQVGLHARRILIDNVLNRVTNSLAADLRKRAARRLLYGDSGTFFAFVGVSLASGTGILTKEEELEGVCWEIREAISKIKWNYHEIDSNVAQFENEQVSLKDLNFGGVIAKGANAVVYSAKLAETTISSDSNNIVTNDTDVITNATVNNTNTTMTSSDSNNTAGSVTNNDTTVLTRGTFNNTVVRPSKQQCEITTMGGALSTELSEYPLALKMMFNYDIQSSAMAILKAMYRETIPARVYYSNTGVNDWELNLSNRQRHLPAHPNIVAMYSVFSDYIPELEGAKLLYPAALPARLHSEGNGRNMSLFLVMKRYEFTLAEYLATATPSRRTSTLLLTQALEGVAHLSAHGIAHRDLKSDNLLVEVAPSYGDVTAVPPVLVISDFGCCLADRSHSLSLPYNTHEIDKGGNSALMAPEIYSQQPGTFSVLNYSRSDLWAIASIAYEMFGGRNPFYDGLRSSTYTSDQLPPLGGDSSLGNGGEGVPLVIRALVGNLLQRNPNKRVDAEIAANICQLYLWAPSYWLKPDLVKLPSNAEILQWLLTLTTKVLCEGRLQHPAATAPSSNTPVTTTVTTTTSPVAVTDNSQFLTTANGSYGRRSYPEYRLISTFLSRARLYKIKAALQFIQDIQQDDY